MEILFRAPEPDDLDMLYRWENDPTQWHDSLTPPLTSRFQLRQYLENFSGDIAVDGSLRLIITADGIPVGTLDLCDYNRRGGSAFVSIYIDPDHRGRGYGTASLRFLNDIAADAFAIRNLAALIREDNTASRHIFAAAGYTRTGLLPRWTGQSDLLIYNRILA